MSKISEKQGVEVPIFDWLGELGWKPLSLSSGDGSCQSHLDFSAFDINALRSLCATRGLTACMDPSLQREQVLSYLQQHPVGCPLDVTRPVIVAAESCTAPMAQYPGFTLAMQVRLWTLELAPSPVHHTALMRRR